MEGGREAPLRPGEGEVSPRAVASCPPTPRESFFRVLLGRVFFVFVFGFNFTHPPRPGRAAPQPRLTSQRSRAPPASRRVRDHLPGASSPSPLCKHRIPSVRPTGSSLAYLHQLPWTFSERLPNASETIT